MKEKSNLIEFLTKQSFSGQEKYLNTLIEIYQLYKNQGPQTAIKY